MTSRGGHFESLADTMAATMKSMVSGLNSALPGSSPPAGN